MEIQSLWVTKPFTSVNNYGFFRIGFNNFWGFFHGGLSMKTSKEDDSTIGFSGEDLRDEIGSMSF